MVMERGGGSNGALACTVFKALASSCG